MLQRIPVVGGLAYVDRAHPLPASFNATLVPHSDHRYFPRAIAVMVSGTKVGYVAPEVALRYHGPLSSAAGPLTCPGRRAETSDRDTSGVELFLDFSRLDVVPSE